MLRVQKILKEYEEEIKAGASVEGIEETVDDTIED
jgi:methionine aminopeptidase